MNKTVLTVLTVALMSLAAMAQEKSAERAAAPCPCNAFRVGSNLETVAAGEIVEFEVKSDDASISQRKFEWTVSSGKIVSGQGTKRVSVRAPNRESFEPSGRPIDRRGPRPFGTFTAVAEYADTSCTCPGASETVAVGTRNRARNDPGDVQDLQLSHIHATSKCPYGDPPLTEGQVTGNTIFDVRTIAADRENDPLMYSYMISGGRIVGTGADVKWDVTGVAPGTYTIKASVDDGCGYCGKAVVRSVTVAAADCGGHCVCSIVDVSSPTAVSSSTLSEFAAKVVSRERDLIFNWLVVNGEIVEGQGTDKIRVRIPLDISNKVSSVTLKIADVSRACSHCSYEVTRTYENGLLKP